MSDKSGTIVDRTASFGARVHPGKAIAGAATAADTPARAAGAGSVRQLDQPATSPAHTRGRWLTFPKIPFYLLTFILFVVLPAIASSIYFAWVASDQYMVEVRFAIRTAPGETSQEGDLKSALSNLSSGSIPTLAGQDAYIVAQYLRSRAAIEDIAKTIDLRAVFSRTGADFWARLKKEPTAEDLEDYWRTMMSTSVDGPSGIVGVQVRSFSPDDSKAIAEALVVAGERLVNSLSERAKRDALAKAEVEVRRTEGLMRDALLALRLFRDHEGILDPGSSATRTSDLLLKAMSERIRVQNDLFVASRSLGQDSPTLTTLRARLETVDLQIGTLRNELTSKDEVANTVSSKLVRYEELEIQRLFSEKLYALAQSALERARTRAERKQIYLSVFVPPYLPQDAKYPERLAYGLILPIALLTIWGIFALTVAAVEDHLY